MIEKLEGCKSSPENLSATKAGEHIPLGCSMSAIWIFDGKENNHNIYRCKDSIKKFCKSLREQTMEIINFLKKKMMPLTKEKYELCLNQTNSYLQKEVST